MLKNPMLSHVATNMRYVPLLLFVLGLLSGVHAMEPDFDAGIALLDQGDPEEAARVFEAIWNGDQENSEAGYNLGLSLFSMGLLDSAAHIFEQVASLERVRDEIRRDALYNLGLSKAGMAQQAGAMNPSAAKQMYVQAVDHFRDALTHTDHDPQFRQDSGYNIEAIWRLVQRLEEQMQQGGQGADSLAQAVQDLAEQQDDLNNRSQEEHDSEQLSQEQQDLSDKASEIEDEMRKRGMEEPADHMNDAQEAQRNAADDMKDQKPDEMREHQDDAMEHLREALASLLQENERSGKEGEEQSSDAQEAAEELARLRREAERQKQEREEELKRRGLYQPPRTEQIPVEKDW